MTMGGVSNVQNARHPMEQPSYRKTAVPKGFDPLAGKTAKLPSVAAGETVQAKARVTEYFDRPNYGKQYGYGDGYQYGGYGQPYGGYGQPYDGYGQPYGGYGQQYGGYENPHVNTYPTYQAPVASQYADDTLTYTNVPVNKKDPIVGTRSRTWMTDLVAQKEETTTTDEHGHEGECTEYPEEYRTGYSPLATWTPVNNYKGNYNYQQHFTDKTYQPGYSKGDWSKDYGYGKSYGYDQGYGYKTGYPTGTAKRDTELSPDARYNWVERSLETYGLNGDLARSVNPVTADGIRYDKYGPQVTPVQFTPARYTLDGAKADPALEYGAPTNKYNLYEAPYVPSMSSAVDLKTYKYTGSTY